MAIFGKFTKAAAVASIATLTLAACSSSSGDGTGGASNQGTDGRGPITFAMGKNDINKIKPVIEAWNKNHPDEQVKLHELAGEADAQRDALVQVLQAQGTDYDVFALDVTDTAQFAAQGWLQPIEGAHAPSLEGLLPATVESATYNGKVYAVPQNTNAQLLYYRTDLVPEAPKNWDELVKACDKAKEAHIDCLDMQLKQYEGLTVAATQFIQGWGGKVVADDGKTPELNSPQAKDGFKALVDGYKNDVIAKRTDSFSEEETAQAFLAGEALFSYNWPYMYSSAQTEGSSKVKDKYAAAPIVGKDGPGASTLGGYNDAINVHSKNKATAMDFLAFMISKDTQMGFAQDSFPPVLSSIYDDPSLQQQFPYMDALKKALESAKPRPVTPFYPAVTKAIQDNTFAALKDQSSPDDALKNMEKAIQQAVQ